MFKSEKGKEKDVCIEELSRAELTRVDIEYCNTAYGKRINRLSVWTAILTVFAIIYIISNDIANGYVDLSNISCVLMIGFGLVAVTRIMYYQCLARYYYNTLKKKD